MVEFVLNDKKVVTDLPKGMLLVDYIREYQKLKGTKSACREGDCGSCTVIEGRLIGKSIQYKAIASCLTPIVNVHGKHIITIEGLANTNHSPIQQSLIDSGAVQCGYCTPGIVLSLTAYVLSSHKFEFETAEQSIGGNICRCTGYKAIERALLQIISDLKNSKFSDKLTYLINCFYIPAYFKDIPGLLASIKKPVKTKNAKQIVGGGTDLFVQKPDELYETGFINLLVNRQIEKIKKSGKHFKIGAGCKISDLGEDKRLSSFLPNFYKHLNLIGSNLIRNMATVGGNLANASPIGDLSIIFLALDAYITIISGKNLKRQIKLKDFFIAYKKTDLYEDEYIESVDISIEQKNILFNFEKISKREHLDIASVNSAMKIEIDNGKINKINLSVGGVAPIPLFLSKTCEFMTNKTLNEELIKKASHILLQEISPIDDIRGSAVYKRNLAKQLFFAHFIELFHRKFEINQFLETVSQKH
jgi:xanthine dehydrogenase small subunit